MIIPEMVMIKNEIENKRLISLCMSLTKPKSTLLIKTSGNFSTMPVEPIIIPMTVMMITRIL